jgi:hypothetical protein
MSASAAGDVSSAVAHPAQPLVAGVLLVAAADVVGVGGGGGELFENPISGMSPVKNDASENDDARFANARFVAPFGASYA